MLLTYYTLKHYTFEFGLLLSYFLFKNAQEVLFHDTSMNIFDKKRYVLHQNIKNPITLENDLIAKKKTSFRFSKPNFILKSELGKKNWCLSVLSVTPYSASISCA